VGLALASALGAAGAAVAVPARAAGRILPLRGLAAAAATLLIGYGLVRYTQLWPPLDDAPYVYGAVLGLLIWPALLWYVTTFRPGQSTLAHDFGVVLFASIAALPLLGAGLAGGANVLLDRAAPLERVTTVLAAPAEPAAAPARLWPVLIRWGSQPEEPLRVELDRSLFRGLAPGTSVRVVTGAGFFGWEYLISVQPAAP
jgi:hypothetical protein